MSEMLKDNISSPSEDIETMSECEVLERVIRRVVVKRNAADVARDLINEFGSLAGVIDASPKELRKIDGVGVAASSFLNLIPLFYRKYCQSKVEKGASFADREDAARYLCNCCIGYKNEVLLVMCLNSKSKLISCRAVLEGSLHSVEISIRKILDFAIQSNASHVIIAHNHVEGPLFPSDEDLQATERIYNALAYVNILLDDHIIVKDNEFISLSKIEGFPSFSS